MSTKTATVSIVENWLTVKAQPSLTVEGVAELLTEIADKLGFAVNQLTVQEKRRTVPASMNPDSSVCSNCGSEITE